jgi:hypothetical protein
VSEDCHDSNNFDEPGFYTREQENKQRAGYVGMCKTCGVLCETTGSFNRDTLCPLCSRVGSVMARIDRTNGVDWHGRRINRGRCDNCNGSKYVYGERCERCNPFFSGSYAKPEAPGVYAPYPHCLNTYGTACDPLCPACIWGEDQERAQPANDELDRMYALVDPR